MTAPQPIVMSASGATYSFFTKDYKTPAQDRYIDQDVVANQNGMFKWVYDNGPGFKKWSPFTITCEDVLGRFSGVSATQQYSNLLALWNHIGIIGMRTPDGVYDVIWAQSALEPSFKFYPKDLNDIFEVEVIVQFEEV